MNYKNTNDYEVLYLIGENKEDALETIYEKYRPMILSFAYKYYNMVKGKGLELDDFIQEGYIGLDRAIKKYALKKECLFYTFAVLCIERQMQTVVRNYQTLKQEVLNNAVSLDYVLPSSNMMVSDVVEDSVEIDPLDRVLDFEYQKKLILFQHSLSIVQEQVFQLRFNGFRYDEIAKLLCLSKKSVDSHLVRIRKKLIACGLKEVDFEA